MHFWHLGKSQLVLQAAGCRARCGGPFRGRTADGPEPLRITSPVSLHLCLSVLCCTLHSQRPFEPNHQAPSRRRVCSAPPRAFPFARSKRPRCPESKARAPKSPAPGQGPWPRPEVRWALGALAGQLRCAPALRQRWPSWSKPTGASFAKCNKPRCGEGAEHLLLRMATRRATNSAIRRTPGPTSRLGSLRMHCSWTLGLAIGLRGLGPGRHLRGLVCFLGAGSIWGPGGVATRR